MNSSASHDLLSCFSIKSILSGVCLLVNFGESVPFPVYWSPAWQDNVFFSKAFYYTHQSVIKNMLE